MILLDTHTWVWWLTHPEKVSLSAQQTIKQATKDGEVGISAISCWEVAMLVAKGRLGFSVDVEAWVEKALSLGEMKLLELTPQIAIRATRLPGDFHGDPADRFLISTAMTHGIVLVTKDEAIHKYPHCRSIW